MGRETGEQRPSGGLFEDRVAEADGGADRHQAEPRQKRSANGHCRGQAKGREELSHQEIRIAHQRAHDTQVGGGIGAEPSARLLDRAGQLNGGAIERMRQRNFGVDEFEPIARQWQCPKEERAHSERMHRGADVVDEPGKRQVRRPRAATDRFFRLEDDDGPARLRHSDGRGQTVWARANHYGIRRALWHGAQGRSRVMPSTAASTGTRLSRCAATIASISSSVRARS